MAKIKVEVDTDSDSASGSSGPKVLAAKKIGLLSSIDLTLDLVNAFEDGAGNIPKKAAKSYNPGQLQAALQALIDAGCEVIATVGGNVAADALSGTSLSGVSVLGTYPPTASNCKGGIVLGSIQANKDRVDYLVKAPISRTRSKIALYRNPASKMAGAEQTDWTSNVNAGPVRDFTGWDNGTGKGDPIKFAADLQNLPATVDTIIISADPFFQENKNALVAAVNSWIGTASRFVCYPLQDYKNESVPPASNFCLYGPSLEEVFRVLGGMARQVSQGKDVGFYTAINRVSP